jgi:hypothetical protein
MKTVTKTLAAVSLLSLFASPASAIALETFGKVPFGASEAEILKAYPDANIAEGEHEGRQGKALFVSEEIIGRSAKRAFFLENGKFTVGIILIDYNFEELSPDDCFSDIDKMSALIEGHYAPISAQRLKYRNLYALEGGDTIRFQKQYVLDTSCNLAVFFNKLQESPF